MPLSSSRSRDHRFPLPITLVVALLAFTPVFAIAVECGEERFVSGSHTLPSRDEAMALCREQEAAMTSAATGSYASARHCHDEGEPGRHGPWHHGRVGMDVVTRDGGGDKYTFEGLWMCKSLAEETATGTPEER